MEYNYTRQNVIVQVSLIVALAFVLLILKMNAQDRVDACSSNGGVIVTDKMQHEMCIKNFEVVK
jgi:hypothetical protein